MASSRHPLSIFPDLNNTPTEITDIGFSEPLQSAPASSFNFATITNGVQWLSAKLSLFQRMYQDTRLEIDQLKRQTKELKQEQEPWLGQCSYGVPGFDGQKGVISFKSPTNAKARSSRASRDCR
ncbi:hypothetical protein ACSBR1_007750 [Camellia fascicularis]